jgi:hypothetical protein
MLPNPAPISRTRGPTDLLEPVREPLVVWLELAHARERHVADVARVLGLAHGVAHDRPHRGERVLQADLLALLVRAAVVRDGHLEDPVAAARHLGRDLRLDAEAAGLDRHRLDDLAAKHLVAGLHVGEVQVGEHVRGERQEAVAHRVPEVQDSPRAAAEEARAVDDVGVTLLDRRQQLEVLHRVVLEVGVLHDHDVARGVPEPDGHRRAFALVLRLEEHADALDAVHLAQDLARPVLRPVVDDQDLLLDGHGLHARDDLADRLRLVVRGDHDGQLHGVISYR